MELKIWINNTQLDIKVSAYVDGTPEVAEIEIYDMIVKLSGSIILRFKDGSETGLLANSDVSELIMRHTRLEIYNEKFGTYANI